ncbi:hypothetical protein [Vibrio vulnificus]|nr:hypothetical protein [Vibrio vulnificus]
MNNNVYDMQHARDRKKQQDKEAKKEMARRRLLKAAEKIKW